MKEREQFLTLYNDLEVLIQILAETQNSYTVFSIEENTRPEDEDDTYTRYIHWVEQTDEGIQIHFDQHTFVDLNPENDLDIDDDTKSPIHTLKFKSHTHIISQTGEVRFRTQTDYYDDYGDLSQHSEEESETGSSDIYKYTIELLVQMVIKELRTNDQMPDSQIERIFEFLINKLKAQAGEIEESTEAMRIRPKRTKNGEYIPFLELSLERVFIDENANLIIETARLNQPFKDSFLNNQITIPQHIPDRGVLYYIRLLQNKTMFFLDKITKNYGEDYLRELIIKNIEEMEQQFYDSNPNNHITGTIQRIKINLISKSLEARQIIRNKDQEVSEENSESPTNDILRQLMAIVSF